MTNTTEQPKEPIENVEQKDAPIRFTQQFKFEAKDNLKEEITNLFSSESTLSEEFKQKAQTVLEAVVAQKVNSELDRVEEAIQNKLKEEIEANHTKISEEMEGYLELVVSEWKEENKVAIESGIKAQMLENFVADFRSLLEAYNIDITDAEVTQLEEKQAEIEALKKQVNDLTEDKIQKEKALSEANEKAAKDAFEASKEAYLNKLCENLAATQAEKLKTLTKDLDSKDIASFEEKAKVIKESLFKDIKSEQKQDVLAEKVKEQVDPMVEKLFGSIKKIQSNT